MIHKFSTIVLGLFLAVPIYAQLPNSDLVKRVLIAPESVFKLFREAEMNPVNHELTAVERAKVEKAFAILPPLYQKILKGHLHSISFMDNMPNTALTSPVESSDSIQLFNITFRAGILNETISEWATQKEYTCYDRSANPDLTISIEAGTLDALQYVLLHEATHVLDAVLNVTPHPEERGALVEPTPYTKGIWYKMNVPTEPFIDSLLEKTRFRSGKTVPIALAPEIYKALRKTPFASLYGMASWFEDLAELLTIYHLTQKMNQPFRVVVKKDNLELSNFEPMKNKRVKKRLRQLAVFYKS
ncbi:MAG: hypothetical protein SFV55_13930 [Haliscomenobacter sp.]|uniref:hypothetical protein n=1 Tax=Haliscomenobacter sp. TaxID=2717303 RepID=UPI0029A3E26E|nr:hypothetical protein [Haliscomenobacter sp.]MDX2069522.1 hypothetical protein [Haliscomenobacter sp.]